MSNKDESSVQIGNDLRDRVYRLCLASGMRNVDREYSVGGKSADVYFEDIRGFDGLKRYAVECKNYARPLGEPHWCEIHAGYSSRRAAFDRLLVISSNGITDNFRQGIEQNKEWITHFTWQEFLYHLVNFQNYFKSLCALIRNDSLDQYYVAPVDESGGNIEEYVMDWVAGNTNRPLAFLAGYGMGKSSLAKRLASLMAEEFEFGRFERIPVYIKLGGLFNQQNIESLITHYFSSEHRISDITPALFNEMNRLGLLLVIFDGFDEMKHGMTHEDFKSVFDQIKGYVVGEARVMVLGRPSALTSDDDRCVLFGQPERESNKLLNAVKNRVVFTEIKIAELNDCQLEQLVPRYLEVLNGRLKNSGHESLTDESLQKRSQEILSDNFKQLIRRPVHADMLCQIAIYNVGQQLNQTSTYELYESFIELIVDREIGKQARKSIGKKDRKRFLLTVAWHFWPSKGLNGFSLAELQKSPIYLPEKIRPSDDIYREMLVGSLLEQKDGQLYYFAHRSFQEFLVAEFILSTPTLSREITKINKELTSDLRKFIHESGQVDSVIGSLIDAMSVLDEPIGTELFSLLLRDAVSQTYAIMPDLLAQPKLSPKQYFIAAISTGNVGLGEPRLAKLDGYQNCAAVIAGKLMSNGLETRSVISIIAFIAISARPILERADISNKKLKNQIVLRTSEEVLWAKLLVSMKTVFDQNGEFINISLTTDKTIEIINAELNLFQIGSIDLSKETFSLDQLDTPLLGVIYDLWGVGDRNDRRHIEYRRKLIQFLRMEPSESSFVFDKTKKKENILPARKTLSLKKRSQ